MRNDPAEKFNIREATIFDAPAIVGVHIESWQHSYKGLVPQAFLDKMSPSRREEAFEANFSRGCYKMFVAEHHDIGVVGFADFGTARSDKFDFDAELYAIYFLPEFQRRGIGGRLFDECWRQMFLAGFGSMFLETLKISPYRKFYENKGGKIVGEGAHRIADEDFKTVFYAWENLSDI